MRRIHTTASLTALLLLCVALSQHSFAAAAWPALPDLTAFLMLRTEAGKSQSLITIEKAADGLKGYDVILFGEFHDHAGNHLAEMQLFRAVYAREPKLALSMEQFERDVQPTVDSYMAGKIGEEPFRSRARAGANYVESYPPLVEYAQERRLPVIAAEIPTALVRCIGQDGPDYLARLSPEKRRWAAAELHLDTIAYRDKFFRFLQESGSHGPDEGPFDAAGKPTDNALRAFASQASRDDTMAESIFLYLQKNSGRKVLHITGAFHVEQFLGTAERLKLRAPNLKIAVINPVQVDDPEHPTLAARDEGGGNFTLLLRATPKEYANDAEKKAAEEKIRSSMRISRGNCAS